MRRICFGLLVFAVAAMPSAAAKVFIDFDKDADHTAYETWSYNEDEERTIRDPFMHDRVVAGLRDMFKKSKLKEVAEDGDLLVAYAVTSEDRTQYSTVSAGVGYGYPGAWGGYGRYGYYGGGYGGVGTTTATTYTKGTLVIDAWDPKTKKLVWRGSATETLKGKPEKVAKQIDKMYAQLWSHWEKIRGQYTKK